MSTPVILYRAQAEEQTKLVDRSLQVSHLHHVGMELVMLFKSSSPIPYCNSCHECDGCAAVGRRLSRASDSQKKKAEQKASMAAKKDLHEHLLSLGLDGTMQKAVKGDECLCIRCGATQMGPDTACTCPGGKQRPLPSDEDQRILCLIAAAKKRKELQKSARNLDNTKHQAAIQSERQKKRDAKGGQDLDDAEIHGDRGNEIVVSVEFPVGQLGMDLQSNVVCKVSTAEELGVKKGWVVHQVEGETAPADKKTIQKAIVKAFKVPKNCLVKFRCPIAEGFHHCSACDAFLSETYFDGSELSAKGPGLQKCTGCEAAAQFEDSD
eukprot:gnl/TRDRNA2_/TRDRNA2_95936_c0_seq1.p1 gnl/TRDRNA2_/TRDRNA2_95936_c0~~gnl/TRDRNA2_/TRDRNA2_95936_c0_seq1.p1  ORF type:complete len:343 (-),score=46.51 gnl/TRDRNA2_/TRDRNA2_95936_c0_seq1:49-1017(-)